MPPNSTRTREHEREHLLEQESGLLAMLITALASGVGANAMVPFCVTGTLQAKSEGGSEVVFPLNIILGKTIYTHSKLSSAGSTLWTQLSLRPQGDRQQVWGIHWGYFLCNVGMQFTPLRLGGLMISSCLSYSPHAPRVHLPTRPTAPQSRCVSLSPST